MDENNQYKATQKNNQKAKFELKMTKECLRWSRHSTGQDQGKKKLA